MKKNSGHDDFRRDAILKKCFNALVQDGIDGITIRSFSDATGMTASSLYYWFEDKDDIVIDATVYGLNYIVEILFDYAIKHIKDVYELCDGFVKYISDYKSQIRLVFQVATSPVYGDEMRTHINKISLLYEVYAKKISNNFSIPYQILRVIVDNFISAIVDYVIWEDVDKVKRQMNYIVSVVTGGKKV